MEKFKYLGEGEVEGRIGAASAPICHGEEGAKQNDEALDLPVGTISRMQAAEMRFLHGVAGP